MSGDGEWASRAERARILQDTFRTKYWSEAQCATIDRLVGEGWAIFGLCGPLDDAMASLERDGVEMLVLQDGTTRERV